MLYLIRETVTDNTKDVELQTETLLQEDINTQKEEYTPEVNVNLFNIYVKLLNKKHMYQNCNSFYLNIKAIILKNLKGVNSQRMNVL